MNYGENYDQNNDPHPGGIMEKENLINDTASEGKNTPPLGGGKRLQSIGVTSDTDVDATGGQGKNQTKNSRLAGKNKGNDKRQVRPQAIRRGRKGGTRGQKSTRFLMGELKNLSAEVKAMGDIERDKQEEETPQSLLVEDSDDESESSSTDDESDDESDIQMAWLRENIPGKEILFHSDQSTSRLGVIARLSSMLWGSSVAALAVANGLGRLHKRKPLALVTAFMDARGLKRVGALVDLAVGVRGLSLSEAFNLLRASYRLSHASFAERCLSWLSLTGGNWLTHMANASRHLSSWLQLFVVVTTLPALFLLTALLVKKSQSATLGDERYYYKYVCDLTNIRPMALPRDRRPDSLRYADIIHRAPMLMDVHFETNNPSSYFVGDRYVGPGIMQWLVDLGPLFEPKLRVVDMVISLEMLVQISRLKSTSVSTSPQRVYERLELAAATYCTTNYERYGVLDKDIVQDTVFVAYALAMEKREKRMGIPFHDSLQS